MNIAQELTKASKDDESNRQHQHGSIEISLLIFFGATLQVGNEKLQNFSSTDPPPL